MQISVVGLGAGGHAWVVIEILQLGNEYKVIGLLEANRNLHGKSIRGLPVLGGDDEIPRLLAQGVNHFFLGVGSSSDVGPRVRVYERALQLGMQPVPAIHPQAVISPTAVLGRGATVMAGALINVEARLGDDVIVNTGAVVEHDCVIGDHVHIASGAILAGGVTVGGRTHIGAGAVVRQYLKIGSGALIGAGAVVVKDIPDGVTVVGNPARPWRR